MPIDGFTQESLLSQLERAWNARDPAGVADCFRPDGSCEWRGTITPAGTWGRIEGRAAIARCAERVMRMAPRLTLAFPVVSYGSDRRLWAEWSLTAAGGTGFRSAVGVAVLGLKDNRLIEAHLYGDPAPFRLGTRRGRALGWLRLGPPPPGKGSRL